MAVWSEVQKATAYSIDRLDAEFFQPNFLELENHRLKEVEASKLGNLLTNICYGLNIPPEYVTDGIPFIRALNLKEYGIQGEILNIPYTQEEIGEINLLKTGDILIVRSGANVGDLGIVPTSLEGATFGSYVIRMRVRNINPYYLYVYLKTQLGREQTIRFRSGTAQPNISIPNLKEILVFKPSDDRQREIEHLFLHSYQQRIKAENLYVDAEAALMQDLNLEKLDLSHKTADIRMLSDVVTVDRLDSDYWSNRYVKLIDTLTIMPNIKLAELSSFSNGATPRGAHYLKAGIPFLRIQNIEKNRLELDDVAFIEEDTHNNLLRRSQLHPGDVLITITGRIGTASVVPDNMLKGNINQHIVRLRLKNKNINPYYLSAFLNSQAGLLQTEREAYGTTREALPYYCLERIIIPFASNDIQKYVEMKIREAETTNQDARDLLNEAKRKIEQMVPDGAKS